MSSAARLAAPALAADRALVGRLAATLQPYRMWLAASLGMAALHALFGAAAPYLTKLVVDVAAKPESLGELPLSLLPSAPASAVWALGGIFVAVLLAQYGLRAGQIRWMSFAGQRAMHALRERLFERLQRRSIAWFDRTRVGRLVTAATTDVESLHELFTSGFVALAGDLLLLAFSLAWMFWLSPPLTAVALLTVPPAALLLWAFRRRSRPAESEVRSKLGTLQSFLAERLAGIATLQLYSSEADALSRFAALNEDHREAQRRSLTAQAWFLPAVEFLAALAAALLLLVSARLLADGAVEISVVVAFVQYGAVVFRPLQRMSEKLRAMQGAFAAAERIFELLDQPEEEPAEPGAVAPQVKAPRVELENVWFAYEGEEWVLRDVSLKIEPGEMVAVVGHTGAGKTTLINLLLRFHDAQRGRVLVGGVDVRQWPREELRRRFGVVLQDPALLAGSIESNIRLDPRAVDEKRALDAAKRVRLAPIVERLPEKYQTQVGERGAALSAGQRQLVGFARALAFNPSFLVLDEATSAVDPETEAHIREGLDKLVEGQTSLVIAHRLSTVRRADRIVVLHHGRIREQGTHQELLQTQGLYWKLYQLQFRHQEE